MLFVTTPPVIKQKKSNEDFQLYFNDKKEGNTPYALHHGTGQNVGIRTFWLTFRLKVRSPPELCPATIVSGVDIGNESANLVACECSSNRTKAERARKSAKKGTTKM